MKTLRIVAAALALTLSSLTTATAVVPFFPLALQPGTPEKTLVIKNMAAEDVDSFFSSSTVYAFEIYKVGDASALVAALQANPAVEALNLGTLTGDYQAFTLVLKQAKSKQWFATTFKKAGIGHIKINRRDIVEMAKL